MFVTIATVGEMIRAEGSLQQLRIGEQIVSRIDLDASGTPAEHQLALKALSHGIPAAAFDTQPHGRRPDADLDNKTLFFIHARAGLQTMYRWML